ncbi:MAG: biotin/lipoyl-binding protein [Gammaproteobacteria bacterium]|nr:biotin/lipoyl-binding protein [Gammaproteobacteria bacterium]
MIELIFSALITVLPDYLYRRYKQGKRLGYEITLYSVWYELRWGITSGVVLAITLLSVIFYFHPTTSNVTSLFRTVTILSDTGGRVEEVYVTNNQLVRSGDPIFRLDTTRQRKAAETARSRIAEVDAAMVVTQSEMDVARGNIQSAMGALRTAEDDLARRTQMRQRNRDLVSEQELEALKATVSSRQGALNAALAQLDVVQTRFDTLLPAQRDSALAALGQAVAEINKATVYAGIDGTVTQFKLKPGDIVNPILRPAGILVPKTSGIGRFQAGFGQISAQVLKTGMITEVTCAAKPLTIIPMVITEIQGAISSGQLRPTDQLIDIQDRLRPGTVLVFMEPIYEGHADAIPPGSACVGVAYTSRAAAIEAGEITGFSAFTATLVDGMGIANAIVIRGQALLLPIRVLVFS